MKILLCVMFYLLIGFETINLVTIIGTAKKAKVKNKILYCLEVFLYSNIMLFIWPITTYLGCVSNRSNVLNDTFEDVTEFYSEL